MSEQGSEPTAEGLTEAERAAVRTEWVTLGDIHRWVADRLAAARFDHNESCATTDQFRDQKARAESAEAERDDLRAALDRVKVELVDADGLVRHAADDTGAGERECPGVAYCNVCAGPVTPDADASPADQAEGAGAFLVSTSTAPSATDWLADRARRDADTGVRVLREAAEAWVHRPHMGIPAGGVAHWLRERAADIARGEAGR